MIAFKKDHDKKRDLRIIITTVIITLFTVLFILLFILFIMMHKKEQPIVISSNESSSSSEVSESISSSKEEEVNPSKNIYNNLLRVCEDNYPTYQLKNIVSISYKFEDDISSLSLACTSNNDQKIHRYDIYYEGEISVTSLLTNYLDDEYSYEEIDHEMLGDISTTFDITSKEAFTSNYQGEYIGYSEVVMEDIYSYFGIGKSDTNYISLVDLRYKESTSSIIDTYLVKNTVNDENSLHYQLLDYIYKKIYLI